MEKILNYAKENYKVIIKRLLILATFGIVGSGYMLLNHYRGKVYHIPLGLDMIIPFNKYFIVPYVIWYFYVAFFIVFYGITDEKKYIKLIMGINIGMLISYLIFYFFPTTVPRPTISGGDIFTRTVMVIYANDNPYNAFPSIHVFESVLMAIYAIRENKFKLWPKITLTLIAISIILSTLFVKQHYVYDAIGGTVVALFSYFVFNCKNVIEKLQTRLLPVEGKSVNINGE